MRKKTAGAAGAQLSGLGPLESRIMDVLWRRGSGSVREVWEGFAGERALAYTTVMTILSRLARKGLLERTLSGRAYVYTPRLTRESFRAVRARAAARGLLQTFGDVAVSQFAEELQDTDPARARRLGELLRRRASR
jgi:predicted transcriptional regulator